MAGAINHQDKLDQRQLLRVLTAVKRGDFSARVPVEHTGLAGRVVDALNDVLEMNQWLASELTRIAHDVGKEGKISQRISHSGGKGAWAEQIEAVNGLIADLLQPTTEVARVIGAVARGDLSQSMSLEIEGRPLKGEFLRIGHTVNGMVEQLSLFSSEVTRVAREVGTEGKLGGQAEVKGVAGTWKDLTDNVNSMAGNLTAQLRNIAEVTTAVANGDLSKKITVDVRGEILELKNTVNTMVDQLNGFASEVTRVAREVGTEGKLGGQAEVKGVAGTWKDLTDNVNQLAANLTAQMRAIANVATAVTKGDLSRSITVEARGEVASLKDDINEMIGNLRETTQKNNEQDWLKTNLARFTRLLQGQRDLHTVSRLILSEIAPLVRAQHGVFYLHDPEEEGGCIKLLASYAYRERKGLANRFKLGEGLVGQCALEKERILLSEVPYDYVRIGSGLGEAAPVNIVVVPVLFEGHVKAVIELASFHRFSDIHLAFLDQLTESVGIVLNTLAASMRTEELLKQSQALTQELQSQQEELQEKNQRLVQQAQSLQASEERLKAQQEELQQTNQELEEKARLLRQQNREVQRKNSEVELARRLLEEKAEQLTLTSKYKSEFLANMSHELRTPLNSMLILAKLLGENSEGNLSRKQIEFAHTIHSAGSDLLSLINDILDLSKIESGTMSVDLTSADFASVVDVVERTFRHVAQSKSLKFGVTLDRALPRAIRTDEKRLQQILKNLLSNAFKFTERGAVCLSIALAESGWSPQHPVLGRGQPVIAFSVSDTGIGIPAEKQSIIFEAFQQADGTTSRKYGGTGLGLSISRELAILLGGEIKLRSAQGEGSTFTLYLPAQYVALAAIGRASLSTVLSGPPSQREIEDPSSRSFVLNSPGGDDGGVRVEIEQLAAFAPVARLLGEDDRAGVQAGDRVLLIVENDPTYRRMLTEFARGRGFKVLSAQSGEEALGLARTYRPHAMTLDLRLPDMDGWAVLDQLKHDVTTRHIPVHVISADERQQRALRLGALGHLVKPIDREQIEAALSAIEAFLDRPARNLLVVEDDDTQRQSIIELVGNADVVTIGAKTGADAMVVLTTQTIDCIVLDLGLPDMDGFELMERARALVVPRTIPIIVYTGRALSRVEETRLQGLADTVIVKGVASPERLLDETALFLHRVESNLSVPQRKILERASQVDPVLEGRTVLIVDDDVRNIYALHSLLERHKLRVLFAENGKDGIEILRNDDSVDVVLMDVMMPEMDGFEAMQRIREMERFKTLGIIALTANAMHGDREKCLEAGASDYITKPVDAEQLLSLLRVWLNP